MTHSFFFLNEHIRFVNNENFVSANYLGFFCILYDSEQYSLSSSDWQGEFIQPTLRGLLHIFFVRLLLHFMPFNTFFACSDFIVISQNYYFDITAGVKTVFKYTLPCKKNSYLTVLQSLHNFITHLFSI